MEQWTISPVLHVDLIISPQAHSLTPVSHSLTLISHSLNFGLSLWSPKPSVNLRPTLPSTSDPHRRSECLLVDIGYLIGKLMKLANPPLLPTQLADVIGVLARGGFFFFFFVAVDQWWLWLWLWFCVGIIDKVTFDGAKQLNI